MNSVLEVPLANVIAYLTHRGWRRVGPRQGAMVWGSAEERHVLLPERVDGAGDRSLVADALYRLARIENRPVAELRRELTEPFVDVQRFRTQPAAPSGSISLDSGVQALKAIQELMSAAGRRVEEGPLLKFENQRPKKTAAFLRRIELGVTQPGSYVFVTKIASDPVTEAQPPLRGDVIAEGGTELASRDVLGKLYGDIRAAAEDAAQAIPEKALVALFAEHELSSNLCTALGGLGGIGRNRPFDIEFAWAYGRSAGHDPTPIRFTAGMADVLHKVGKHLEKLAKSGPASIVGRVEGLERKPYEAPRVKLVGRLRTRGYELDRTVWVVVDSRQYDLAYQAQKDGRVLRVDGQLTFADRRSELRPASTGFVIE